MTGSNDIENKKLDILKLIVEQKNIQIKSVSIGNKNQSPLSVWPKRIGICLLVMGGFM